MTWGFPRDISGASRYICEVNLSWFEMTCFPSSILMQHLICRVSYWQIAEVVNNMQELMTFSCDNKIGPIGMNTQLLRITCFYHPCEIFLALVSVRIRTFASKKQKMMT